MKEIKNKIETLYLDYVNNFLTVECFSEYYGLSLDNGYRVITIGRYYNRQIPTKK